MLDSYRKKIDKIDKKLTLLFEERMDIVKKIGNFKKEHSIEICAPEREVTVIEKRSAQLKNLEYKKYLVDFFENLMRISREFQTEQKGKENE